VYDVDGGERVVLVIVVVGCRSIDWLLRACKEDDDHDHDDHDDDSSGSSSSSSSSSGMHMLMVSARAREGWWVVVERQVRTLTHSLISLAGLVRGGVVAWWRGGVVEDDDDDRSIDGRRKEGVGVGVGVR
jgi:hypothetical protein